MRVCVCVCVCVRLPSGSVPVAARQNLPSSVPGVTRTSSRYIAEKRRASLCVGCGGQIHDQFILRVAPDLEWHASCLKCADCSQFLDETCTCFVREGKTYCKRDYVR